MVLANHHANFDNFDSKYQPWNSVALGLQNDLIGGQAKAARKSGRRFGVSVHTSRARSWYDQAILEQHRYKTAATIIARLTDIVSKNGNLILNVPLRRDGTPDVDEIRIISDIGACLKVKNDAIYATHPWKIYSEGPSTVTVDK